MMTRASMRFLFAAIVVAAAVSATVPVARAQPHHPVNASLWYPISTNRDPATTTNFRLNIFYGRVGALRGVDLGGVVARVDGDLRGGQLALVYSHTGRDLSGISLSAGVNYVGGDARGGQAGLVNYDRGRFSGVQYGYLFNFVEGEAVGGQLSTIFNLTDGDARYLQLSGVGNVVGGDFRGVQLASFVNHANGAMAGVQVSVANFAFEARGLQFGVLNATGDMRGAQIGVVNLSRSLDGVPVGMVNWTDGADADWITFGSNFAAVASGVRTIVGDWYSVLALGFNDLVAERDQTGFFSWHYGRRLRLTEAWSLGADLGVLHVIPEQSDDPNVNEEEHPAAQGRLQVEWRPKAKFSIFAGGGASLIWEAYRSDADTSGEPLFFGGISLF
jgi:hypothetical protein